MDSSYNNQPRTPTRNPSLAPVYGRASSPVINPMSFSPFGSSWDLHGSPSTRAPSNMSFANMSSSSAGINSQPLGDEPMSTNSRMDDTDDLHVEKSRVLEQLRHMTSEVDRLENRLQAVKRKRARAIAAAMERHQRIQETEASEMRFDQETIPIIRLQNFTNIAFTSIHNRILSTLDSGVRIRQYQFTGSCSHLEFDLQFTVEEPSLELGKIHITVPREVRMELSNLIARTERDSNLLRFFQALSQYVQMDEDRSTLINNLAKRFPDLIKSNRTLRRLSSKSTAARSLRYSALTQGITPGGPGVQTLVFCGSRKASPELVLQWVINVTEHGRLTPRIQLLPRMNQKWKMADTKSTLEAIPTQFVRLLQLKGAEGAVAVLLQCVYGRIAASVEEELEEQDEDDQEET
ncbi:hypothetical protein BGZ83_000504 [Gryganskiella cystojenkinii]|nr:hypothetical protein BGZ83_000504 [Gryganskiella cystojenkinii]